MLCSQKLLQAPTSELYDTNIHKPDNGLLHEVQDIDLNVIISEKLIIYLMTIPVKHMNEHQKFTCDC